MSNLINRVIYYYNNILVWLKSLYGTSYKLKIIDEFLPNKLSSTILYIVQEDGFYEHASMICPCGCGEILHMNLIPDERPLWKIIKNSNGTISLHPSIWRKNGCRSHFWLRNSCIYWCIQ